MQLLPPVFRFLSVSYIISPLSNPRLSCPGHAGEPASACHGSVLQGQFEGTIHTENGTYHIEPSDRYTSSPADHHSIIYREDDMGKTASTSMKRLSCTQTSSASGVRVPVMLTVQDICVFAIQMIHHDLNFLVFGINISIA